MARKSVQMAKFGWFWSNDVEQTPERQNGNVADSIGSLRSNLQETNNSIERTTNRDILERREASTMATTPSPLRPQPTVVEEMGRPQIGQNLNGAGGLTTFPTSSIIHASQMEHRTPERRPAFNLTNQGQRNILQSPFQAYALALSPITPSAGSSALQAARSLGPLYPNPRSPPPSSMAVHGSTTINQRPPLPQIGIAGDLGALGTSQKDRAIEIHNQRHLVPYRSFLDGSAQKRPRPEQDLPRTTLVTIVGSLQSSDDHTSGQENENPLQANDDYEFRKEGKTTANGQAATRRRLSSTFNEAFHSNGGEKVTTADVIRPVATVAGSTFDITTSNDKASPSMRRIPEYNSDGERSGALLSTEDMINVAWGNDINNTPIPLTPLHEDELEADENACVKDGDPPNSQSKKKKAGEGGCKKCNCKKSRCLKLYCECFAAGIYCEGCNCQNCLNTAENEALVQQTRKTIESRNPLAFAPKIIDEANNNTSSIPLPSYENVETGNRNRFSLASALRHKKGCNCKKSHCLKKYCECYQAGVKCTDLCKCINCKNCQDPSNDDGSEKETPATIAAETELHELDKVILQVSKHDDANASQELTTQKLKSPIIRGHKLTPLTPHPGNLPAEEAIGISRVKSISSSPAKRRR